MTLLSKLYEILEIPSDISADLISFTPQVETNLTSDNVQGAIDELDNILGDIDLALEEIIGE